MKGEYGRILGGGGGECSLRGNERFENGGSVLSRPTGRGYTRGRRSPTLQTHSHRDTPSVASYDTQGSGGRILPLAHRWK